MRDLVLRRLLAVVLVMGMIAHVAAVVRHGAMLVGVRAMPEMASATNRAPISTRPLSQDVAIAALQADLEVTICQPGGANENASRSDERERRMGDCPICAGLACAFTLPPHQHVALPIPRDLGGIDFPEVDQRVARHRFLRPASRGPPTAV